VFLPQGQPLGKALFKFGHGSTGAQGILKGCTKIAWISL